jgi:hypothetical protein
MKIKKRDRLIMELTAMQKEELQASDTGYADKHGNKIRAGHMVTTHGSQTVYNVGFDGDIPVLIGVKPLSYVNCKPSIVGFNGKLFSEILK